jgi:chaperone required for assembly of F1-ATPase
MKRFYKTVTLSPENAVLLDGKQVKTPARNVLKLPLSAMAEAIAEEWRAQGEEIISHSMPLTKLANTTIDHVAGIRGEVIDQILEFGGSDLLCYRAEAPPALTVRQQREWQPLLDWASSRFGMTLQIATGILHVTQPPEAFAQARAYLESRSDFELAASHAIVGMLGSLVLTLALLDKRIDAATALGHSRLDEEFQAEQWGRDAEADARTAAHAAELDALARFLSLSRS